MRRQREGVEKELGSDELTLAGPGGADAAAPEDTDAVCALVARYDELSCCFYRRSSVSMAPPSGQSV